MPYLYPSDLEQPEGRQKLADMLAYLQQADGSTPQDRQSLHHAFGQGRFLLPRLLDMHGVAPELWTLFNLLYPATGRYEKAEWAEKKTMTVQMLSGQLRVLDDRTARRNRQA